MKIFSRISNPALQDFNLIRDDSSTSRVYRSPNGTVYDSVTSYLSKISKANAEIEKWILSIGAEEAGKVLKRAGERGTEIHAAAECLLKNQSWYSISMFYHNDFLALKNHIEKTVDNVFAQEHQMYSDRLMLAGTVDLIAEYDGVLSVIDFKTSSRIKYEDELESYYLQEAAYSIMTYERYGLQIKQLVTLMVVEGDPVIKTFIKPAVHYMKQMIKLIGNE